MGIGIWQIIVILLIVLIVFGAGRLPQVMGDLGKGIKSFKDGLNNSSQDKKDTPLLSQDEDEGKDV